MFINAWKTIQAVIQTAKSIQNLSCDLLAIISHLHQIKRKTATKITTLTNHNSSEIIAKIVSHITSGKYQNFWTDCQNQVPQNHQDQIVIKDWRIWYQDHSISYFGSQNAKNLLKIYSWVKTIGVAKAIHKNQDQIMCKRFHHQTKNIDQAIKEITKTAQKSGCNQINKIIAQIKNAKGKNHSLKVAILFVFDSIQSVKYKINHNFIISEGWTDGSHGIFSQDLADQ